MQLIIIILLLSRNYGLNPDVQSKSSVIHKA
jgi:hypothetical protein